MTCYSQKILRGQKESCWCQRSCALLVRSPQEEGWYTDGYRFLRQQKKATSLRSWWLSVGESIIQACVLSVNKTCLQPQSVWAAITRCRRLSGMENTETYFSQFWSLGSPRARGWQIPCLVWSPIFVHNSVLLCPHMAEGLWALIPEGTKHSWPDHFPKATPPNAITLGVRTSTYEFWEDTNVLVCNKAVRK